jgi:hypothetical protein
MTPCPAVLVATALAVAWAAEAHGQPAPHLGVPGPIVPPRIEIGGGGGVSGTSPDVGILTSVPLGDRLSFDVGASYLARVWRSPAFGLGQAQIRIPFRRRLRSRYSLLAGATYLDAIDPRQGDSPLWREGLYPHAGASMQWPIGRGFDLRVDAQLVVQFDELIPVAPRAAAAFVWHAKPPPSVRATGGTP